MNKKWFLFSNTNNRAKRLLSRSSSECLIEKKKNFVRSKLCFTTLRGNFTSSPVFNPVEKPFFSRHSPCSSNTATISRNIECQSYFESRKTSLCFSSRSLRFFQKRGHEAPLALKSSRIHKISLTAVLRENVDSCAYGDVRRTFFKVPFSHNTESALSPFWQKKASPKSRLQARALQVPAAEQGAHLSTLKESVPLMQKNQSEYKLETFVRSNQDTCLTHKPSVFEGDWVQSGDFLTDCANSVGGELSLGQNIFIAYMPWEGYNFEDAILISERLVTDDLFTSVHIERYEIENLQKNRPPVKLRRPDGTRTASSHKKLLELARYGKSKPHLLKEKLGKRKLEKSLKKKKEIEKTSLRKNKNGLETNAIPKPIPKKSKLSTPSKVSSTSRTPRYEEITRDIPDVSAIELSNLDSFGIIKVGSFVEEGDILVGKISPIKKKEFTPYQKLLYTILNKQILPYRDSSLRAPKGIKAKVIDIKIFMKPGTVSYSSKVLYKKNSLIRNKPPEESFISPSLIKKKRKKRKKLSDQGRKLFLDVENVNKKYMRSTSRKRNSLLPQENLQRKFSSALVTNKMRSFLLTGFARHSSNLNFLVPFSKKEAIDKKSIPIHPFSSLLTRKRNPITNGLNVPSSFSDYRAPQQNLQRVAVFSEHGVPLPPFGGRETKGFSTVPFSKKTGEESRLLAKRSEKKENLQRKFSSATEYFNINKYAGTKVTSDFRRKKLYVAKKDHKRNKFHRRYIWPTQKKSILVQIADSPKGKQLKNLYKDNILFQKHPLLKQQRLYDSQPIKNIETIHIYLAEKRKVQVGDKMSGRHGNKGIVSQILPVQDMPFLPDGTAIDMVLNPLGVPSRMNVGQIYECLLGLAGRYLGENYKVFAFDEIYGAEASRSFVFNKLYEASCKTGFKWLFNPQSPGKIRLFDGRSGNCFDQPVTVGQAYMLRLVHMVDDKIHMRSTGPYSLVTQQPLRGRSKQGGQRLGEMEVWALEGYGAAFTLLEMLTVKSDDLTGRMTLWSNLILNKDLTIGTPEAFKVLICELQALCLDIGLFRYNKNNDILMKKDENKTLEDRPLSISRQTKSLKEMTSLMSFP